MLLLDHVMTFIAIQFASDISITTWLCRVFGTSFNFLFSFIHLEQQNIMRCGSHRYGNPLHSSFLVAPRKSAVTSGVSALLCHRYYASPAHSSIPQPSLGRQQNKSTLLRILRPSTPLYMTFHSRGPNTELCGTPAVTMIIQSQLLEFKKLLTLQGISPRTCQRASPPELDP